MTKISCLIFTNNNYSDRLTFLVAIRLTTWPMPKIITGNMAMIITLKIILMSGLSGELVTLVHDSGNTIGDATIITMPCVKRLQNNTNPCRHKVPHKLYPNICL